MIYYDTQYSTYEVDEEKMLYRRLPLGGKESQVSSPRLSYNEWHPLQKLPEIVEDGEFKGALHIMRHDSVRGIYTSAVDSILVDSISTEPEPQ